METSTKEKPEDVEPIDTQVELDQKKSLGMLVKLRDFFGRQINSVVS